jgi:hypothetical protein
MVRTRQKVSIERALAITKKRRGTCLSRTVLSAREKLSWKCQKGHLWKASFDSVRRGAWCAECAGVKKLSLSIAKAEARKRNGKCLSDIYINGKSPLLWECERGHRWKQNLNAIRSGTWCGKCHAPGLGQGISEMRALAKSRGGVCLSKKYKTARLDSTCDPTLVPLEN